MWKPESLFWREGFRRDMIFSMHHGLLLMAALVGAALMGSCAPAVHVLHADSRAPGYTLKEIQVTGRVIFGNNEVNPELQVQGLKGPDGLPLSIWGPLSLEVLKTLNPEKRYQITFYLEEQSLPDGRSVREATLSKVEDEGTMVVDASVCDVHHRPMRFLKGDNINYGFEFKKENRDLWRYHNHGYFVTRGDDFGWKHQWEWRCPDCARKVASFRSAEIDS